MNREFRNKTCKIDHYSIMVASKYFNDIEDFINLELASSRFEGNMDRFRFNPIPLTQTTKHFFPSLETLHLYNQDDERFDEDKRIFRRIHWYLLDYKQYLQKEKTESDIFKGVCYTKQNRIEYGETIPKEVNYIDDRCFCDCSGIERLELPSSVIKVSNHTFVNCISLREIKLPNSIESLGKYTFSHCISLRSVNIPTSLKEIGQNCFAYCISLEEVIVPESVTSLDKQCFAACKSLQNIDIPTSVKEIGDDCFSYCSQLTSISLPFKPTELKPNWFRGCTLLKEENIHYKTN